MFQLNNFNSKYARARKSRFVTIEGPRSTIILSIAVGFYIYHILVICLTIFIGRGSRRGGGGGGGVGESPSINPVYQKVS